MVTSNEPGFYLDNEYGIRIENLQYVVRKNFDEDDRIGKYSKKYH